MWWVRYLKAQSDVVERQITLTLNEKYPNNEEKVAPADTLQRETTEKSLNRKSVSRVSTTTKPFPEMFDYWKKLEITNSG